MGLDSGEEGATSADAMGRQRWVWAEPGGDLGCRVPDDSCLWLPPRQFRGVKAGWAGGPKSSQVADRRAQDIASPSQPQAGPRPVPAPTSPLPRSPPCHLHLVPITLAE